MKPIACACGLEKEIIKGYAVCGHCETHCAAAPHCPRCRQYSILTNQRVTAEHEREKSK